MEYYKRMVMTTPCSGSLTCSVLASYAFHFQQKVSRVGPPGERCRVPESTDHASASRQRRRHGRTAHVTVRPCSVPSDAGPWCRIYTTRPHTLRSVADPMDLRGTLTTHCFTITFSLDRFSRFLLLLTSGMFIADR